MKKLIAILLILLMLVGCGGKGGDEPAGDVDAAWKFTNVNVRQAMLFALDRDAIAKSLNDGSIAAQGIIPVDLTSNYVTGTEYRAEVGKVCTYDVEKAKEYYAKACEELGVKEISIDLLYGTNEGDSVIKAAEQIAYYLEEVGFKVNLVSKQKKERLELAKNGDFEVMLTRWGPDYGDPQTYMDLFTSWNYDNNYGHWANENYDNLVTEAEAAGTSKEDRWADFVKAENILVAEDAGVVPVFQAGGAVIHRPGITGIQYHSAAVDDFRHIEGKDEVTVLTNTDVLSWDSCIATDGTSFIAQTQMISGLFALDAAGNPYLDLAESYDISEDGLTYTFKIKDDACWANGTDLTANDFVFAWNRILAEETASEYSWWFQDVIPAESFKAVDDKTLELKLSKPSGLVEAALAFPSSFPINEEFFNSCGDTYATSAETLLACGPFVLDSWTPGYSYEFSPNPTYVNAADFANAPKKVVFRVLEDTQTALMEYEAGNLDTVILSGEQVTANADKEGYIERLQGYLFYLQINIDNNIK